MQDNNDLIEKNDKTKFITGYSPDSKHSSSELHGRVFKILEEHGVDFRDTNLYKSTMLPLPHDHAKRLLEIRDRTNYSDDIYVPQETFPSLCDLWASSHKTHTVTIPSDIFFAHQIPLPDVVIWTDTEDFGPKSLKTRITILKDYEQLVDNVKDIPNTSAIVGIITTSFALLPDMQLITDIKIDHGCDSISSSCSFARYIVSKQKISDDETPMPLGETLSALSRILATWYGIQISLLHPIVKEIYADVKPTLIYDADSANKRQKNKKNKRKTRYVRRLTIYKNTIHDIIEKAERRYNRKTLVWYVLGHWRNQNGKQVFINGYWKGPLRELQQNIDEGRDRELALPSDDEEQNS